MLKKTAIAVCTLGVVAGAAGGLAPDAAAAVTVSGTVTCIDQGTVVGVWIQADGGSGYASRTGSGYQQRFSKGGVSGRWTVHVGCGGSSASWAYTANGNTTVSNANQSWTCYTADIVRYPFCQVG